MTIVPSASTDGDHIGKQVRVNILGNGGREDALRWKFLQQGHTLTADMVNLTVVGPEALLADGIVDRYNLSGRPIVGPDRHAARLETSKLWAKQFMVRHDIPTARFMAYKRSPDGMNQCLADLDVMRNDRPHRVISATPLELENPHYPVVIKEDGLCGGKGVVICKTKEEIWSNLPHMFINNIYKSDSNKILVEDFVVGEEASCFVLSDGYDYKMLPFCKDHKRLHDNDKGPNTGGMGAYAPTPIINKKTQDDIRKRIVEPTLVGMRSEGIPFKGVLYIGLMISPIAGPQVIEYNVRFGDPECQVLMMLWEDDLYDFLYATAKGGLGNLPDPTFYNGDALTVTLCSQGYPREYKTGYAITGLDINKPDVQIFHAGVKDGMTAGGRVLNVTARGESLDNARETVYNTIKDISFENMIYRTDIGKANG